MWWKEESENYLFCNTLIASKIQENTTEDLEISNKTQGWPRMTEQIKNL